MSKKVRDDKNRWRSKTIAFRISPEENQLLEVRVKLSGLTKQDYIIRRCLEKDIVVYGNSRVHKALSDQMKEILDELQDALNGSALHSDFAEILEAIVITLYGLGQEGTTRVRDVKQIVDQMNLKKQLKKGEEYDYE